MPSPLNIDLNFDEGITVATIHDSNIKPTCTTANIAANKGNTLCFILKNVFLLTCLYLPRAGIFTSNGISVNSRPDADCQHQEYATRWLLSQDAWH